MRKGIVQGFVRSSTSISLQNDLPFSMSSQSDKEILLLPLSSDGDFNDQSQSSLYKMINNVINKKKNEDEKKVKDELVMVEV